MRDFFEDHDDDEKRYFPQKTFHALCRDLVQEQNSDVKVSKEAASLLQVTAEDILAQWMAEGKALIP